MTNKEKYSVYFINTAKEDTFPFSSEEQTHATGGKISFVHDDNYKFMLLSSEEEEKEAVSNGWELRNMETLEEAYKVAKEEQGYMLWVDDWKHDNYYILQGVAEDYKIRVKKES